MKNTMEYRCAAVQVNVNSFFYDGIEEPVLKDTSFQANYGEITLLSGISGCGKSTLISLINGVIPRISNGVLDGEVLVDGKNTASWSMSDISGYVGSVLQNAESQIIYQKVEDEIAFGCENNGVDPDEIQRRVTTQCEAVKLKRDMSTRGLSGGQKQRLVTAAALAMETDILLFDEPLANLDQTGAKDLLELLKKLCQKGKAVILVEHRLDIVLPYVDVVWELKDGKARIVTDKQSYLSSQVNVVEDGLQYRKAENSSPGETLLKVRNLSKAFGTNQVLHGLNCEISRGERILILGENGCGKSTFLQILARLMKAEGGEIIQTLDTRKKKKADKRWFHLLGMVCQNPNYQLFMPTVRQEILFGAEDEDYGREIASRFGLDDLLERHPHSLSEGQKRRVTIAAILAQKPKLLLLDEPTVGQDYAGLRQLVEEINKIHQEQNNTMITITHDFRCAAALCDRALHFVDGQVTAEGGKEFVTNYFINSHISY